MNVEWKGKDGKYKIALKIDGSGSTITASITGQPYEKVADASKVKGPSKGKSFSKEKGASKEKDAPKDDKDTKER